MQKLLFFIITLIVITGCGVKGPLYLPEKPASPEKHHAE